MKKKKLLKNDEVNHLTNIILDLQPEMKLKYMFISTHGGGIFLFKRSKGKGNM